MCDVPIWVLNTFRSEAMFGLPNESMIAIVTPVPSFPAEISGVTSYEFRIVVGLKHRRCVATGLAEKHCAWVGGVSEPLRNWKSLIVGAGVGNALAAAPAGAATAAAPATASAPTATITARRLRLRNHAIRTPYADGHAVARTAC